MFRFPLMSDEEITNGMLILGAFAQGYLPMDYKGVCDPSVVKPSNRRVYRNTALELEETLKVREPDSFARRFGLV